GASARKTDFPVSTRAERGAGLPLRPWTGIGDAYIRETRQNLNALKKELENAEATTDFLVREAWYRLDLAKREEILYRSSVLKLAKDALDVSTRGYEAGNVSFADVIASYGSYLNQNLSAQRKLSDMGVAWADLEMVVGAPLAPKRKEMNP
ncbi:MAG TPA: TolC family protein, partial [Desulfobacteria bacterium]|nr:TolC family protein [Desulfobacteria bacterium]